ncbi:AATF family protein [Sporobolomyces salmoneus]|uniref:AATF family protein n=1 Tax=Sporobolomyces salmoneus TaxID=183962 RepID=UPI00317475AF
MTLAEQLAQIQQPAPQDFDPEEAYTTYNAEKSEDQKDSEAARADYVDVGESRLRKKGEAIVDSKYEGKKASRKALYGSDDDEDEDDEESELGGNAGEDDEEEEEVYEGEFADLLGPAGTDEDSNQEEEEDSQDEDSNGLDNEEEEDDEEQEEEEEVSTKPSKKVTAKQQDERVMMKELKQAASADVEKGRDVKKQLAFCDNLLESRIRLQKATAAANLLPQPFLAPTFFSHPDLTSEVQQTFSELASLSEELFSLRQDLIKENEKIEVEDEFGESRKRKRRAVDEGDTDDWTFDTLKDLAQLETTIEPFLRQTVTKWSDKVLAASGQSLTSSSKKFKAINQNSMAQIDHSLSSTERERLIKRTRVRRGEGKVVGGGKGLVPLEGESSTDAATAGEKGKEIDEECFDDNDFYQQLLREVVESRMLDLDDATMNTLRLASARGKKVKKQVDTRASKGRKIRYHVHEKIQNFMIPIEAATWHDEQIDELFASLLGRSLTGAAAAGATTNNMDVDGEDEGNGVERDEVQASGLRIF